MSWKDNVSFVLVETMEPGNIGASARAIKNLGFSRLELVAPKKYPAPEAGWFSHSAEDVLAGAVLHPDLSHAVREKALVVAASRRVGKGRGQTLNIKEAALRIKSFARKNRVAVLFGREDRGLTNEETARCAFVLHIPADKKAPSYNLAMAVLLVAYELSMAEAVPAAPRAVPQEELEALLGRVDTVLEKLGYVPRGQRELEERIRRNIRHLAMRAGLMEHEVRMLHGLVSQVEKTVTDKLKGRANPTAF